MPAPVTQTATYERMPITIALRPATFDHKETRDCVLSASDCSQSVRSVLAAAKLACTEFCPLRGRLAWIGRMYRDDTLPCCEDQKMSAGTLEWPCGDGSSFRVPDLVRAGVAPRE